MENASIFSKMTRFFFRGFFNLLFFCGFFIFAYYYIRAPKREDPDQVLDISEFLPKDTYKTPGLPVKTIPNYSVESFDYVSIDKGKKQWRIIAKNAFMYQSEKLTHVVGVEAFLFDDSGEYTRVIGEEGKFSRESRDLEVYGSVTTQLSDGTSFHSDTMKYSPGTKIIDIPEPNRVTGISKGKTAQDRSTEFKATGLHYAMNDNLIYLHSDVEFFVIDPVITADKPAEQTQIISDKCRINRNTQIALFTMLPTRPAKNRYVITVQKELTARSRTVNLNYGDFKDVVNYLTAVDDVLIKEDKGGSIRYATGGMADFDSIHKLVILTKYPQVYQNNDTLTGDRIVIHRDTDIVDIDKSNAFSEREDK